VAALPSVDLAKMLVSKLLHAPFFNSIIGASLLLNMAIVAEINWMNKAGYGLKYSMIFVAFL
jgi:hypothetical protein